MEWWGLNNGSSMGHRREITYDDGIWNPEYPALLQYPGMELPRHGGSSPSPMALIARPWSTSKPSLFFHLLSYRTC